MNNYYNNIARRFEEDFQLLKLLFLSFSNIANRSSQGGAQPGYRR
jgi:hypothetical protein